LVSSQVYFLYDTNAAYSREEQRSFRYMFMKTEDDHSPSKDFISLSDIQEHLKNVQDTFQTLEKKIFQKANTSEAYYSVQSRYKIPIYHDTKKPKNPKTMVNIDEGFKKPFDVEDPASIKKYLSDVLEFKIMATNIIIYNELPLKHQGISCQNWTLVMNYDIKSFTKLSASLESTNSFCDDDISSEEEASVGISVAVVTFAIFSFFMSLQKIKKVNNIFLSLKSGYMAYKQSQNESDRGTINQQAQELVDEAENPSAKQALKKYLEYENWEEVPVTAKLKFFNPWFFVNTVGNIFQIISSLIIVLTFFVPITSQNFYVANVTLGFSAFFTWVQFLQYLKFWKDVTLITTTMYESASNLKVFFGISFPTFIGMGILAYSLFWKYEKFISLGESLKSLYEMAGGDIVHETYLETWDEGVMSTLFLTIYMILFFTALMNILVAVMMEGYDRGVARKEIDNDDPFPTANNLSPRKSFLDDGEEDNNPIGDSGYNLKEKIEKQLSRRSETNSSMKNVINLLLHYNAQAKMHISDMVKVKKNIKKANFDETTQRFLYELLSNSFNKIIQRISYYRIGLNKSPVKKQKNL